MTEKVVYKDRWLAKGSHALFLWEEWKKSNSNDAKKKLDRHMDEVEKRYQALLK